jgi:hypothetical protein
MFDEAMRPSDTEDERIQRVLGFADERQSTRWGLLGTTPSPYIHIVVQAMTH